MRSFRGHYLRHDSYKFHCPMCPRKYLTQVALAEHSAITEHSKQKQKCKICQVLVEFNDFKEHRLEHQNNAKLKLKETKWKCTLCGKL